MQFSIDWEKHPLIPAIVQDVDTKEVLMLAYMNEEALQKTLSTGFAHYYSRSRQKLWKKGESSGNVQKVESVKLDCDSDTILLEVKQQGPACHTGRKSCFYKDLLLGHITSEPIQNPDEMYEDVVDRLYHIIQEKKEADPSQSWTAKLFSKGENSILKKVVEEAGEFCFAVKDDDKEQIIYECADLVYHTLVALASKDISPELIRKELKRRFGISGIEEKASRSK
ncbi:MULTISPECIES: bifunctional phosphoribosyl-AMP cyclohydrolase/phosphoribosyl-ATP diphosphatase HisIE [unclassified Nitratiruptor]|uniref:bifunctional phosphoribosyl-AMP cyclohydrolase/phosphoribosyl-ATP diphosphatase HisIE n=1 Tax=unclassified Nitratiruptor TaxID=2624044 RepID=UPI001915650B|nr:MULTISPECIES: bifunctional phosphoribosyl-AMP cyclohydrolase/phosphoribosyl-ATP diphosphatase HisIE [unclassified Nitratiruptor]BCD60847.1 phosphoribosyl-ATP pyrophosphohydrolase / phosphoribosyl-AMP cyclohydrolase [Nitratiruptor sp. YY08-10]BCD64779.1 phosphoribosyl-ATP pyrophosphohydrolase / phosphoribosyl-AMP cyclohydrolase [Nitratiruptor sp. YY08-14]